MSTFYVDQNSYRASDGNSGTSLSNPLQSLAKANTIVSSGDVVFIKKGTYRETLNLRDDGITWEALEPDVKVLGTKLYNPSWTSLGGGLYRMSYTPPPSVAPFIASSGATLLIPSLDATVSPGEFIYDDTAHTLTVNLGGAVPTSIEIGERAGFVLTGLLACTIKGIEFVGSNTFSVRAQGGGGHQIIFNKATYAASGGIRIEPPSPQLFTPVDGGTGSLGAGTYGYVVTAMISTAETLPSFERTITVAAGRSVLLQWSNVQGATGYKIYARTVGGERLMFTGVLTDFPVVAGFPTFTDTGALTPGTGTVPIVSGVDVEPCLVEHNEVMLNNSHGVYLYGASGCTIRGNYCHHNTFHGVALLNGSNDNLVELNRCHSNVRGTSRIANGIQCDNFGAGTIGSSRNIIRRNFCYRNEDSGISVYNGSADCVVSRNVCYDNGDHGIDNFDSARCIMANNTIVDCVTAGLNSEGNSLGVRMFNNISVDNGINSPRTTGNYRVDATVLADAQLDYNLSYLTVPAANQPGLTNGEITWGGSAGIYDTLGDFKTDVPSQMAHGASANPLFADRSTNDFRLQAGSPANGVASVAAPGFLSDSIEGLVAGLAAGAHPTSGPAPPLPTIVQGATATESDSVLFVAGSNVIWLPMFEVYA